MQMKNPLLHVGLKHEVDLLNLNHRKMSCSLALLVKERTRVVMTLSMLFRVSDFMFQFYINCLLFFLFYLYLNFLLIMTRLPSLCVGFCTGYFVTVPLNLTYLHCLQHSFFGHLFNLYYQIILYLYS